MEIFFLIFSTLSWGIAEIFYKLGSPHNEKYAHLKIAIFVGIMMGIYATVILFTQGIDLASFPMNFVRYLPVSACYIVSMVCSYFGVRYVEESISDPIENSSIALVPILSAIFIKEAFEDVSIPLFVPGMICVVLGIVLISVFGKHEERKAKFGKKLGIVAFTMPFCYMILDAVGTFLDIFYVDDIETTPLIGVTEANIENTANCCYEFTFLLVAIALIIFLKCKKVKIFENEAVVHKEGTKHWYTGILDQKWKLLAALFETAGQATYLFALSDGGAVGAVILGAGTVLISFILSAIFLKERLSPKQYISLGVILAGIVVLSLSGV